MIQEVYCSYEVAKLLKEKGFNEYCLKNYWSSDKELHDWKWELSYNRNSDENRNTKDCAAPTQQMAMKWLRKVHNILLFILPAQENGKLAYLVEVWTWNDEEGIYESTYAPMPRKEPEQAIEAAIKYVLENLI